MPSATIATTATIGSVCYVLLKGRRAQVGYTGVNLLRTWILSFRDKFNPEKCSPLEHLAAKEAEVTCELGLKSTHLIEKDFFR